MEGRHYDRGRLVSGEELKDKHQMIRGNSEVGSGKGAEQSVEERGRE